MSKHNKNKNNAENRPPNQLFGVEQYSSASFEAIQKRAYEIYQQRGGSNVDNWLQAEEELRQKKNEGRNKAEYSNNYAGQNT